MEQKPKTELKNDRYTWKLDGEDKDKYAGSILVGIDPYDSNPDNWIKSWKESNEVRAKMHKAFIEVLAKHAQIWHSDIRDLFRPNPPVESMEWDEDTIFMYRYFYNKGYKRFYHRRTQYHEIYKQPDNYRRDSIHRQRI